MANLLDGLLHFLFKFVEPVLNLTLSFNALIEVYILHAASKVLVDGHDKTAVLIVEGYGVNSIEKLLEVVLHSVGV